MSDDKSNVVYPTRFQRLKDGVKDIMGIEYEPMIFIDTLTLMTALGDSEFLRAFSRMYPEHTTYKWLFEIKGGELLGVTVKAARDTERTFV